jgi:hypothetical protein
VGWWVGGSQIKKFIGGLVGWWVGGLVGWWVGRLVGWWVGGLVVGWLERNWYWVDRGKFSRQN